MNKKLATNENPITSMFLFCAGILVILPLVDSCLRKKKKDLEKNGKKTEKSCPSINFTDLASAAGGGALFSLALVDLVPELAEKVEAVYDKHYPLHQFLFICGIFFVAIVDDITQKIVGCFISANKRRPSCRNLLSESNESEAALSDSSGSTDSMELRAVRFQIEEPDENAPTRKAMKLIIGLSIHSCLTGLTVGMMGEGLQTGLIALIPHKAAVLFLLSSMLIDVPKGPRTALIITFSAALPLGLIAAAIVSSSTTDTWTIIILEAIGAGAVMQVAIFEMLPDALSKPHRLMKIFTAFLGALVIAFMQTTHAEHGEHGEEHHLEGNHHDSSHH
ncbi:Oidioi.mRNA.OKI2018_I69.PAR.g10488.t1.cds [Oikopleura dioica]|uniref:Oidioi.mRNA.OKI2018_I69.PAR.g10488.t1.cds n=1 Tax=Oikopleura dioica TaxID=34765 RepID=A0ABN7RQW8_OIKDI|nr:Oidioi.mRNA.OKI2018_I69.PAR.g10488.t1.cds [Oikopleura dioica]